MTPPSRPGERSSLTLVRRSAGLGTVLLSVLGISLCAASAAGVWAGKRQVHALNAALFRTADDALHFTETRLDRVRGALETSRHRVGGVSALAERLKIAGDDARAKVGPLTRALDDVFDQLKSAEHGLDSVQVVVRNVNKMSDAVASSRAEVSDAGSSGMTAENIAELSARVDDALIRLQAMRQELIDARSDGQLAREFARGLITRAAEMDERLAKASARIDQLKAQVSITRRSAVDLGHRVRWWTAVAAVTLALVSTWFAISQVGMLRWGWRLARGRG